MKRASLLLTLAIAVILISTAAPKANAGVVVGVSVGAPVYVPPAPRYAYVVPRPYVAYVPAPVYSRLYVAPTPVYYRHWYRDRYYARRDYHSRWDRGRGWDRDGRRHRDWR